MDPPDGLSEHVIMHYSVGVAAAAAAAEVNYMLLVLCIAVVAGFQSGTAIGNAYGAEPLLLLRCNLCCASACHARRLCANTSTNSNIVHAEMQASHIA